MSFLSFNEKHAQGAGEFMVSGADVQDKKDILAKELPLKYVWYDLNFLNSALQSCVY